MQLYPEKDLLMALYHVPQVRSMGVGGWVQDQGLGEGWG